jgi:hypothetical protein
LVGALLFSMREARIVEHERQVAQQHFDSVRTLANTMLFDLHDEMAKDAGSLKSRELLVKTSLGYLDASDEPLSCVRLPQGDVNIVVITLARTFPRGRLLTTTHLDLCRPSLSPPKRGNERQARQRDQLFLIKLKSAFVFFCTKA